jgi:hypothetical protein
MGGFACHYSCQNCKEWIHTQHITDLALNMPADQNIISSTEFRNITATCHRCSEHHRLHISIPRTTKVIHYSTARRKALVTANKCTTIHMTIGAAFQTKNGKQPYIGTVVDIQQTNADTFCTIWWNDRTVSTYTAEEAVASFQHKAGRRNSITNVLDKAYRDLPSGVDRWADLIANTWGNQNAEAHAHRYGAEIAYSFCNSTGTTLTDDNVVNRPTETEKHAANTLAQAHPPPPHLKSMTLKRYQTTLATMEANDARRAAAQATEQTPNLPTTRKRAKPRTLTDELNEDKKLTDEAALAPHRKPKKRTKRTYRPSKGTPHDSMNSTTDADTDTTHLQTPTNTERQTTPNNTNDNTRTRQRPHRLGTYATTAHLKQEGVITNIESHNDDPA